MAMILSNSVRVYRAEGPHVLEDSIQPRRELLKATAVVQGKMQ